VSTGIVELAVDCVERFGCEIYLFERGTKGMTIDHGKRVWISEPAEIRRQFEKYPNANYSIRTGGSIACLDLDTEPDDGYATLVALIARHGALESGPICLTPRSGLHYFFESAGLETNDRFAPGLDWHDLKGTIVGPGSVGSNGVVYEWAVLPEEAPLVPPPPWLVDLARKLVPPRSSVRPVTITNGTAYGRAVLRDECAIVASAEMGERNSTLNACAFKVARYAVDGVVDATGALHALLAAALVCGLSEREATATITSSWRAGLGNPRRVVT
jgi:hypothetical protein